MFSILMDYFAPTSKPSKAAATPATIDDAR